MVEMELLGVRVELPTNTPMVLLREVNGPRMLSIFIGGPEATAIAFALEGVETPRPLTHDLMREVLRVLDADLERIVLTRLVETTYYADLHLRSAAGARVVSARPSDAIALAVRFDCVIQATEELLDQAGFVEQLDEGAEPEGDEPMPEEVVEEFRTFIDQVRPEDFGS